MKELYKDKYLKIIYHEGDKLMQSVWLPESEEIIDDETIKAEIQNAVKYLMEYKPEKLLADDRDRRFPYSVSIQQWVAKTLGEACAASGVKKFAVLYPKEFVAKVSTELTAKETEHRPYLFKFFTNYFEAIEWLKAK